MRLGIWSIVIVAVLCSPTHGAPATAPVKDVEVNLTKIDSTATLISGKLKDASASEMFSKLGDAAGVVLTPKDESVFDDPALQSAAFSTQWDKQPFWDALHEACEAASLRPVAPEQEQIGNPVLRIARGQQRAPECVDGVVQIRLRRLVREAGIEYFNGNHASGDRVHATLWVLLEPKIRGWAWIDPPRVTRATDERGHALATTQPTWGRAQGAPYSQTSESTLTLTYPPRDPGTKLAVLDGAIPIQLASEMATVTFHQPLGHAGDMSADVGPNKLLLKSFTRDESGQFKLVLVLSRGEKETDEHWKVLSELVGQFLMRVSVICPNGPVTQHNTGGADQRDNYVRTELMFPPRDPDDQPTDLRVQLPSAFTSVSAKFQFKDVPMP